MKHFFLPLLNKTKNSIVFSFLLFFTLLFLGLSTQIANAQAFRTTWITTDGTITIPTNTAEYTYNYDITWTNLTNAGVNEGSATAQTGDYTITGLENNSTYEVAISGDFPHFYMNFGNERLKLRTIREWGDIAWTSMENAFQGCSNLTYAATDTPNLAGVTSMSFMFTSCSSFNANLNSWNTSTITDMGSVFRGASIFNGSVGSWNTAAVTDMSSMFNNATNFNQNIGNWNTAAVTTMSNMFSGATNFNRPIGNWNTAAVTNMSRMFSDATEFNQNIGNWNTAAVTNMSFMFNAARRFNQNIANWNTAAVTDMGKMFNSTWDFNQPIGNWNTAAVTDMSSTFAGAWVFNQDLSNWNTTAVTTMRGMFDNAYQFNQDISNWNTTRVTDMAYMFNRAMRFNQNISSWNTSLVTDMNQMFRGATIFNQPIGNWNTQNVTNMFGMFADATSFNQNLGNWNISSIVQPVSFNGMTTMLNNSGLNTANYDATLIGWAAQTVKPNINLGATGLTYCAGQAARNILTSSPNNWIITGDNFVCSTAPFRTTWITTDGTITIPTTGTGYNYTITWTNLTNTGVGNGSATGRTGNYTITGLENNSTYEIAITGNFPRIYMNDNSTEKLKLRTIEEWGDINWTSMNKSFYGCTDLTYNATDNPNLSGVTDLSYMFSRCFNFNGNIGNWNTATITDMSYMFNATRLFNQDIGNWNTAAVTNMASMFSGAGSFNQDIGNWNTAAVTNMASMFIYARLFNQNIGNWNTAAVTNMSSMFREANAFNQDIGNWNTTAVTNMSSMFLQARAFNQDIGRWNTQAVTDMSSMFCFAISFNQNIEDWNTQGVTSMIEMFLRATSFNQDIGNWNTAAVTNMSFMLNSASAFNQDIGDWDISNVLNMYNMLDSSGLNIPNYDATLIGWAGQTVQPNVELGASNLTYCAGANARSQLITNSQWSIREDRRGGTCAEINVQGNGLSIVNNDITPNTTDNTDFGTIATCNLNTIAKTFTIQNTGTAPLTISNLVINGTHASDFSISGLPSFPFDVAINATQNFTVTFNAVIGIRTATIEITNTDADENPYTFAIQATGTADTQTPTITAPSNITANTDTGICTASNVALGTPTGTDNCGTVTFSNNAPSIFPIGTTTVIWTADDGNGNTATATQTITISDAKEINLLGNGISITDGTSITSTNDNTDFGDVGSTRTITYTLQNTGTENITVSSITSNNTDFVVSNIPTTVLAGSVSTFDVTFSSVSLGLSSAIITINNNDCDESVYDFAIQATKINVIPPPPPAPIEANLRLIATAVSSTQINLKWTSNTRASSYLLYRDEVFVEAVSATSNTYSDENLTPDTFYSYKLIAVINSINSLPSWDNEWTFPEKPTLLSLSSVCGSGGKAIIKLTATGSIFKVYNDSINGTLLLESSKGSFELPFINQTTTFYVSVVGNSGKESKRLAVNVRLETTFESVILDENGVRATTQSSCTNSLLLKAQRVENADFYMWLFNGIQINTGTEIMASYSGIYQLLITKDNCSYISDSVKVFLNQKPLAKIEESNENQSIYFCENGTLNAIQNSQNSSLNSVYEWKLNNVIIGNNPSLEVLESGIYSLFVSTENCKDSTSIEVSITETPQIPILKATQDSICKDSETTLFVENAETGMSYLWTRNGRMLSQFSSSITTNVKGNYQVSAFLEDVFCSSTSNEIEIYHFADFVVYLRENKESNSIFIEAANLENQITNVEWYFEGELKTELGNSFEITPTEKGYYSAKVTNQNGCIFQTRTIYFTPKITVTGEEEIKTDTFKIYPNPNNGIFKLHFETVLLENTEVIIFDGIGRKIHTQTFEKGNQEFVIDVKSQSKGMYLIHFNQNNKVYSKQIIIE